MDPLAVRDLHHSLGRTVDPDHLLDPLHAESGMGRGELALLPAHRPRRAELAQRPGARALDGDARAYLEGAAVLDADPDGGPPRDPEGALRSGERGRGEQLAEIQVR